ncbi:ATP-binding protein [Pedobacter sp. HMF7647]|uniref:histidine kinase n=1 Tax=Hufsiella arboris TaxID=2695275 RepID=A0A7K1Y7E9_9SPHI|nr:ATP-binding protein [Hufsiella arboris]
MLSALVLVFCSCQKQIPPVAVKENPDYKKAQSFLYHQNDSAFYYFNKVVSGSKDSLQIAVAYNNMAVIQSEAGDFFGCQESLLSSLGFLNETKKADRTCLASDFNELGLTSLNLKDYDAAIRFHNKASTFSDHKDFQLVIQNNKALAYQKKGSYPQAINLYKTTLGQTKKNSSDYARILSNLARTKWLQTPSYNAAPELQKAMQIRQLKKDTWGLNASYAHLTDFYTTRNPDSALFYARQMFRIATTLDSPDDQLEALQKLIKLAPAKAAQQYFIRYQRLNDSLQTARNAAKNQFALIRYDAEKNKSDNLRLQKDNTEKKFQIVRQRLMLYGILAFLISAATIAVVWYKKRKRRIELEAQNAIQEHKLRTSKKVHDVVANGLYRIMTELEYKDQLSKEQLIDEIDALYEQSRDISYDRSSVHSQSFHEKITGLISSFDQPNTKVVIIGNNQQTWSGTSPAMQNEVWCILQELMINMKKHSKASHVTLRFKRETETIFIRYHDDGVGMTENVLLGNGLTNTGNRISVMKGELKFEAGPSNGLWITMSFPLE